MGNCHALFGKGPTEKDSDERTSPVAYFTLWGAGGETPRYPEMVHRPTGESPARASRQGSPVVNP